MERFVKKVLALPAVKKVWEAIYEDRRDRRTHPTGEFDSAARFYPAPCEQVFDSFKDIRRPTRSWPYPLMIRARTRQHAKLLVLAKLFFDPGYVGPVDVEVLFKQNWFPASVEELAALAILPKKYQSEPDARALAMNALRSYLTREDDAFDPFPWGVLADWLDDRGQTKHAAAIRAELPKPAAA